MIDSILSQLPQDHPWRSSIQYFDSVDSTNTLAKAMAAAGAPSGTVLIANHQTGGRGRLGRSFHSPAGTGIYLSVILRPACAPDQLMHLTCAAAVAMCCAVEKAVGIRPGIKWTNDLVCGKRKLAGILTELSVDPHTGLVSYAIVGIGINCTQQESDFPKSIRGFAGSLAMVSGQTIDRSSLAAEMIRELEKMDRQLLSGKQAVMDQYRADCVTIGKDISLLRGEEVRHGHAVTVDECGALVVRFLDGHCEAINSGEVSIRGMYGYI